MSASHPTLGYSEASVIVETLSPPSPGNIVVSPASGKGVKTVFNIEAIDFNDEDIPLSYQFGYKKAKAKKIQWFKKISSSLPSFDTKLPAAEVEI